MITNEEANILINKMMEDEETVREEGTIIACDNKYGNYTIKTKSKGNISLNYTDINNYDFEGLKVGQKVSFVALKNSDGKYFARCCNIL